MRPDAVGSKDWKKFCAATLLPMAAKLERGHGDDPIAGPVDAF